MTSLEDSSCNHFSNGTYAKKVDFGVGCQEGQTFSLEEGLTGQVVRDRSTVILRTYSDVAKGHISPDDPRWNCAVIGVPIQWDERVIGTCIIFGANPERVFTPDDAALTRLSARTGSTPQHPSTLEPPGTLPTMRWRKHAAQF